VCRKEAQTDALLRLRAVGDQVSMDRAAGGRGASVCVNRQCIDLLSSKILSLALRKNMRAPQVPQLHQLAQQRVLESVGLARRQGELEVGIDRILEGQHHKNAAILVANDLSERSLRKTAHIGAQTFIGSEALGKAAGMNRVGAMKICSKRLGNQASYWLNVWHATQPSPKTGTAQEVQHG